MTSRLEQLERLVQLKDIYGQDVEFHDMAVMNAEDQAAVVELEGQYSSLPAG